MTKFQRARSEEQREERRVAILGAAAAMLGEMSVAELSLNELSRRVGLAKSNVMRYFESREAVLLELLNVEASDFLSAVDPELTRRIAIEAPVGERVRAVANELSAAYAQRPILCELLSAQASVLERNVSTPVAVNYKKTSLASLAQLSSILHRLLPELDSAAADRAAWMIAVLVGALWSHGHPTRAVEAAYAQDPTLARARVSFTVALEESIETFLRGLLAELNDAEAEWSPR